MQFSPEQFETLRQIGIPIWLQRAETAKVTPLSQPAEVDLSVTTNWFVLADLALNQAEQCLLDAMLSAVKLDLQSVSLLPLSQLEDAFEYSTAQHKIIVFDMVSAQQFYSEESSGYPQTVQLASSAQLSVTYSLSAMLENPALKRHAWQALKCLFLS